MQKEAPVGATPEEAQQLKSRIAQLEMNLSAALRELAGANLQQDSLPHMVTSHTLAPDLQAPQQFLLSSTTAPPQSLSVLAEHEQEVVSQKVKVHGSKAVRERIDILEFMKLYDCGEEVELSLLADFDKKAKQHLLDLQSLIELASQKKTVRADQKMWSGRMDLFFKPVDQPLLQGQTVDSGIWKIRPPRVDYQKSVNQSSFQSRTVDSGTWRTRPPRDDCQKWAKPFCL